MYQVIDLMIDLFYQKFSISGIYGDLYLILHLKFYRLLFLNQNFSLFNVSKIIREISINQF